jgi:uncharacterized protein (DUF924 family)
MNGYEAVIDLWFNEIDSKQWFVSDPEFDALIAERFMELHGRAVRCELFEWRSEPLGRLAEIIVIDQFSRNIFRNRAEAFAYDSLALALAQEAVRLQVDSEMAPTQRAFLYMPYMHSESAHIHELAVELFSARGLEKNYQFELKHKAIIDRFGRYPHRNAILGRQSSDEELAFLSQPGSSF